jgi:hypothetical protein
LPSRPKDVRMTCFVRLLTLIENGWFLRRYF